MEIIRRSKSESAQRFFEIFLYDLQLAAICLLAMTFLRFLTFWSTLEPDSDFQWLATALAFVVGLRFDILILGFVSIVPVVLFFVGLTFRRSFRDDFSYLQKYFLSFWFIFCVLAFFDLDFFVYHSRHMQWPDHAALDYLSTLSDSFHLVPTETIAMSLAIWICTAWISIRSLREAYPRYHWGQPYNSRMAWKWIVPLIIVALMARGTVSAHHLERRDSQISSIAKLNEITLNPAWTFDKNFDK